MSDLVARIRKGYLDLADGQLHYRRRDGVGTPIIFLHQTASSSRMWEATMQRLGAANPLWALDTPGFGGSFDPDIEPVMSDYLRWLTAALDKIGANRAHFVGHHTGASIALAFGIASANRTASLTLLGPAALDDDDRGRYAGKLGAPFRPGRSGAYLLQNWEYLRIGGAGAKTGLLHREMIDMLRGWESRPHAYRAVWAQDTDAQLRQATGPLHLISSPDDLLYTYFEATCRARPDALRTILSGGANFSPDLVPEELTAALEASRFFAA